MAAAVRDATVARKMQSASGSRMVFAVPLASLVKEEVEPRGDAKSRQVEDAYTKHPVSAPQRPAVPSRSRQGSARSARRVVHVPLVDPAVYSPRAASAASSGEGGEVMATVPVRAWGPEQAAVARARAQERNRRIDAMGRETSLAPADTNLVAERSRTRALLTDRVIVEHFLRRDLTVSAGDSRGDTEDRGSSSGGVAVSPTVLKRPVTADAGRVERHA